MPPCAARPRSRATLLRSALAGFAATSSAAGTAGTLTPPPSRGRCGTVGPAETPPPRVVVRPAALPLTPPDGTPSFFHPVGRPAPLL